MAQSKRQRDESDVPLTHPSGERKRLKLSSSRQDTVTNTTRCQDLIVTNQQLQAMKRTSRQSQFIFASRLENNPIISSHSKLSSQSTMPSIICPLTSDPCLTTRVPVSIGFWSPLKREVSSHLWWPAKAEMKDVECSTWNGPSTKLVPNSPFSTRILKLKNPSLSMTSWSTSTYTLAGRTVVEARNGLTGKEKGERSRSYKDKTKDEIKAIKANWDELRIPKITRARAHRLALTPQQRHWMRVWMKDAHKTYNLALDHILRNGWHRIDNRKELSEKTLQSKFVTKAGLGLGHPLLRTPKVMRQQAIKELVSHIKGFHTKFDKRVKLRTRYPHASKFRADEKFNPTFKSKSSFKTGVIALEKVSAKRLLDTFKGVAAKAPSANMFHCYRKWKTPKGCTPFQEIMCSESLPPDAFTSDFKIALKDDNRFYLILPRKIDLDVYQSGEQETKREDICAIDPGIRKFATAYSPSGPVRIYGHNVKHVHETYSRRIQSKRAYVIKVQRAASDGRRNRRRIRRAAFRLKKAKNRKTRMVQDFHYKLAHVLCRTYKTIIYPDFSTQGMGGLPDIVKKRAAFGVMDCSRRDYLQHQRNSKRHVSCMARRLIRASNAVHVVI
jgi:hypothetical protein